jgi:hypothetical protein
MPHDPQHPPTLQDYCAAVKRFTDAIDRVLERGRALERRYEAYCRQHDRPYTPTSQPSTAVSTAARALASRTRI